MGWTGRISPPLIFCDYCVTGGRYVPQSKLAIEVRADADKSTGLRLVRKLKKLDPDLGVVILSPYGDRGEEVLEMLKTMRGIVYRIKGLHQPEQLQQAIRFAQRGDIWIDPVVDLTSEGKTMNILRTLFMGEEAQIIERALTRVQELTPAEREVLRGAGRGRTTKGLAQELSVSTGTIESHINRIYAKLFGSAVDTGKFRRSVLLAKVALLDLLREQES